MGAVTNMRPDLFSVVVAGVPFVDVVNTMLDPSIPLTVNEYEEWGNPNDYSDYMRIKSYSPYDNIGHKELSAHSGNCGVERSACAILGTGQMGGQTASIQDRRQSSTASDQHGRQVMQEHPDGTITSTT